MKTKKTLLTKYKHAWLLSYGVLYGVWFSLLEARRPPHIRVVHMFLDDYVPFHEIFVIPYYLWFGYVAAALLVFFFLDVKEYYQLAAYLFTGMTICLIIYTIWPNGQNLRPDAFLRDNALVDMVKAMYRVDTSTNVWPSIHVYNSIVVDVAISKSLYFRGKKWLWLRWLSHALALSICLSTVFIKQHSVSDGLAAIVLAAILYPLVYRLDWSRRREEDTKPA